MKNIRFFLKRAPQLNKNPDGSYFFCSVTNLLDGCLILETNNEVNERACADLWLCSHSDELVIAPEFGIRAALCGRV